MLEILDKALQRLYWAWRNHEDLPENLIRGYKASIITNDILQGLGFNVSELHEPDTRKSSTDTAVSSLGSQDADQVQSGKTTPDEDIFGPALSPSVNFGFDPPSPIPGQVQSADTTPITLADLSASPYEAIKVRTSSLPFQWTRFPQIPHRDSCQLHLVCRRRRLERQTGVSRKASTASSLGENVSVPMSSNESMEDLTSTSSRNLKNQLLGKTVNITTWTGSPVGHRSSYDSYLPSMSRIMAVDSPMQYQTASWA
ncbi:hypothetical protein EDD37DRAFT_609159 [Exophiala viscosa]|uniref:uncharacterized protein n=1 Tax=Exophiala viscosa TaxID=2486360 RepID=UPI00219F11F4|nr:hypothetical protein EDD37DRAFT_609159 [Exophiala viscosa]